MVKKNKTKQYLAIIVCMTGLMSWSAECKIEKLEEENILLNKQVIELTNQISSIFRSFFWGTFGGLTSAYKPSLGRVISGLGLAYYRSFYQTITVGIGHIFGHLIAQRYQTNSNNQTTKKLGYW